MPTDEEYIIEARDRYASDDIDIDDAPKVSRGENGAFVAAWVWVADPPKEES